MRISDWSSDVCSSDLEEVLACEGTGVLPCVPKTLTSGNAKRGLFTGQDFLYDDENDRYTCPAGQYLTKGKVRSDRRDTIDHYRNLTACPTCALKPRCTLDKIKRVKRWEHRSEEHTSELQSLMRNSYAVFCLNKNNTQKIHI